MKKWDGGKFWTKNWDYPSKARQLENMRDILLY